MTINCPYCKGAARLDRVDYACPTCGAEFSTEIACRMQGMNPLARAERIGDYHGRYGWGYLWCMPEMDRETLRRYAAGFIRAAPHDLEADTAWRDAFGRV